MMRSIRQRRGVTLVLVALLITVLTGLTAFGVDFSRMYAARAQLKVVTDAAALSAVTDLAKGVTDKSVADARALLLRRTNLVEQRTLTDDEMNGNDIVPVRWSRNAVAPFPVVAWRDANAVQVTARYTANWLLARIFGVTQKRLTATSVAALGSPWQSRCFKPWAIPYTNVLATLGRTPTDTSYRLTDADIALLRDNRVPIAFKVTSGTVDGGSGLVASIPVGGNYYAVRFPPVQYADGTPGSTLTGGKDYRQAIADPTCAMTGTAAVGDWLDIEQGNKVGPTLQGVRDLCGGTGQKFSCNVNVEVPIWNRRTTTSASTWVQILYIGAFTITGYDNGLVIGRLLSLATSDPGGGFTPYPGPVTTTALVQ